jgi:glycosyltransferase involved in cell wall biosynthesis
MSSSRIQMQSPSSAPAFLRANGAAVSAEEAQGDMSGPAPEVSVVMPCLNEGDTLATCIEKANQAFRDHGISGEIVIADNGSQDGSQEIATGMGAVVVHVQNRGYGNALMGGIARARGRFIIMGDSDDSYDFREIPRFVSELRKGHELVQGCRFPSGGGTILPGAMPFHHRWWGNPLLSYLVREMFQTSIHDVYCGMRGFTKALYQRLDLRATGMEFATEMIIKASLRGEKMTEVPITLHPDGRKSHPPHLRTFRDGWRTLRFFLMYCPRWLFLIPGFLLLAAGLTGYGIAMPGLTLLGATFDAHTLLFASLAVLLGYQSVFFALFTKTFAISEGLLPEDPRLTRLFRVVTLERGLLFGASMFVGGSLLLLGAVNQWRLASYGPLDYAHTMRWVIPGVTLSALGFATILGIFFLSILQMRRR